MEGNASFAVIFHPANAEPQLGDYFKYERVTLPCASSDETVSTSHCPFEIALLGFEPRITESKSGVLPLHYKAVAWPLDLRRAERKPTLRDLAIGKM